MSDAVRKTLALRQLIRTAGAAGVALLAALPAGAQEPLASPPSQPQFMSRYDFRMSAAALGSGDKRFSWDIHWAGDFDLVDYVFGRLTFLGDYQALLGSEFRPFDPYQSNYVLEAAGSLRRGSTEIVAVLNHVSRHLGDRPKRIAVADNSLGGRVLHRFSTGTRRVDLRADLRKVIERAYVDYDWIGSIDVRVSQPVARHADAYGRAYGERYAVDPPVAGRERQLGGRLEGGVRIRGTAGAIDLFAGIERVVDADPIDRMPRHWAFAGFRLLRQ